MRFLIPGVETRAENGATLVIPGSHLWGMDRVPKVEDAMCAELALGEALVILGSVYHAGGQNSTTDDKRSLHGLFFCQGFLRSEVCCFLTSFSSSSQFPIFRRNPV